jgi:hypothetical protein
MKRLIPILIMIAGTAGANLRSDLNSDGRVDFQDFAIMADEWLLEEATMHLNVSGTLDPNVAGDYSQVGTSNGQPVYFNGTFYISYSYDGEWVIDTGVATPGSSGFLWLNDALLGDYLPSDDATGTATVAIVYDLPFSADIDIAPAMQAGQLAGQRHIGEIDIKPAMDGQLQMEPAMAGTVNIDAGAE